MGAPLYRFRMKPGRADGRDDGEETAGLPADLVAGSAVGFAGTPTPAGGVSGSAALVCTLACAN